MKVLLTLKRGKRAFWTVEPLTNAENHSQIDDQAARKALANATTLEELRIAWINKAMEPFRDGLSGYLEQRKAELTPSEQTGAEEPHSDQQDTELWQQLVARAEGANSLDQVRPIQDEFYLSEEAVPLDRHSEVQSAIDAANTRLTKGE
jgi:hypothetical protein